MTLKSVAQYGTCYKRRTPIKTKVIFNHELFCVKLMCSSGKVPSSHLPASQPFRAVVLPFMAPDSEKILGQFKYSQE